MLKAIFAGKVLPSNNIAGELVEIVTGAQVVLPDILVSAESVGFAGRNSARLNLRATQTPSPDHSDAIAQILARQANLEAELAATKAESSKTKEELARTQKKLSRQEEKTKSLSRVVSPNAENDGDAVGGGFVRRLANADPAQGRQMIADYHHGMHERIGGIAAVAGQNQDHVESHTERLDRLEQQLAEANRKNKNKDRCVTM